MIEFRRITVADLDEAVAFACEGIRPDLYPTLHLDRHRVRGVMAQFIDPHPDRFHLAAFEDGRIVGGVSAVISPMLWFERCEAHLVMLRATVAGAGRALLKALKEWADADLRVRRVIWPMEFHSNPRVMRLAARYGFTNTLSVACYYKESSWL